MTKEELSQILNENNKKLIEIINWNNKRIIEKFMNSSCKAAPVSEDPSNSHIYQDQYQQSDNSNSEQFSSITPNKDCLQKSSDQKIPNRHPLKHGISGALSHPLQTQHQLGLIHELIPFGIVLHRFSCTLGDFLES